MEDDVRIGSILRLLGVDASPPVVERVEPRPPPPSGLRIVDGPAGAWIELDGADGTFRIARPKCRMVLHMMPVVAAWAGGARRGGSSGDVRWSVTERRGASVLEIVVGGWKPVRMTREQAAALVAHEAELREFVSVA